MEGRGSQAAAVVSESFADRAAFSFTARCGVVEAVCVGWRRGAGWHEESLKQ